MTKRTPPVQGVHAPPARPTFAGALWLAVVLSLPVGAAGLLIEAVIRLIG